MSFFLVLSSIYFCSISLFFSLISFSIVFVFLSYYYVINQKILFFLFIDQIFASIFIQLITVKLVKNKKNISIKEVGRKLDSLLYDSLK